MKFITLYDQQIGLVFKRGQYLRTLTAGRHFLGWGEDVAIYQRGQRLDTQYDLGVLLQDERFRNEIELVTVADNELALQYEDGIFATVLNTGRYVFVRGVKNYRFELIDRRETEVDQTIVRELIQTNRLLAAYRTMEVAAGHRGILVVDGEMVRELKAGRYYFWVNGKKIEILQADMRLRQLELAGQEILTKDKATLRMNFYAQYQITDLHKALVDTQDMYKYLYLQLQLALREYVGTLTLDELLANKTEVQTVVLERVTAKAQQVGVKLQGAGVRDIILTGEMREIMNRVLVAEKQAQANTILRREETAATRTLLNTAKLLQENDMLLRLKEMEYMEKIADKVNTITVGGGDRVLDQLRGLLVREA